MAVAARTTMETGIGIGIEANLPYDFDGVEGIGRMCGRQVAAKARRHFRPRA